MRRDRIIIAALCVAAIGVCVAGNNWVEQLQLFKHGDTETQMQEEQATEDQDSTIVEDQLQSSLNNTSAQEEQPQEEDAQDQDQVDGESTEVVLYFASADGNTLEGEVREIPKEDGIARATMNQLISGPRDEDLTATLPTGTELLDINISNGLCTVDFNEALMNGLTDSGAQLMALYSIVNTLTQFDSVEQVQILVEGQQLGEISGVDASQAMTAMSF